MRKFTKHVFSVLASGLLLLAPANRSAVPAYPGKMKVKQADGSVLVRVRKQYNEKADVSEYFN